MEAFYYTLSEMRALLDEYDALCKKLSTGQYDGYWIDVERRDAIVSVLEMQALEMARYIVRKESEG